MDLVQYNGKNSSRSSHLSYGKKVILQYNKYIQGGCTRMILDHIWGLYTHPKEEWHCIDERHENVTYSLIHLLILALVPVLSCYYSVVNIGWQVTEYSEVITLTPESAIRMAAAMYCGIIGGVFALAYLAYWMAKTFDAINDFTQCVALATYTATPIFMSGLAAFYPVPWVIAMIGTLAVGHSVYLLYTGVPVVMHIPEEKGFIYASSLVTSGLVLLVIILAASVMLWSFGIGPIHI